MIKVRRARFSEALKIKKLLSSDYDLELNFIKESIKLKTCLVASFDSELAGALIYTRDFSHYANYVEYILTSKKFRGKGIARGLINEFIRASKKETPRKQKYALSSTDVTNKTSIKMHKSLGFKEIGRIKGLHYGKDEIIFGYNLR